MTNYLLCPLLWIIPGAVQVSCHILSLYLFIIFIPQLLKLTFGPWILQDCVCVQREQFSRQFSSVWILHMQKIRWRKTQEVVGMSLPQVYTKVHGHFKNCSLIAFSYAGSWSFQAPTTGAHKLIILYLRQKLNPQHHKYWSWNLFIFGIYSIFKHIGHRNYSYLKHCSLPMFATV